MTVVDAPARAPADRAGPERDRGRDPVCHLLAGGRTLCGRVALLDAIDVRDANCLGPMCDGPGGCGLRRCPKCRDAWLERELAPASTGRAAGGG